MKLDKILHSRKTVKKFSAKGLSWQNLSDILEAGRWAPSAGNLQNWVFIVVKKNKDKLTKALAKNQQGVGDAPVLVVVCADMNQISRLFGPRGEALYAVQNCAAAIENMLLKATELGVASCWIGDFDEKKVSKIVKLKKSVRPQAVLAFGYGKPLEEKSREPLQYCTFFEEFENRDRAVGAYPVASSLKRVMGKALKKKK